MEQSLAPGSQTFEQDLFRLYRDGVITLDEALVTPTRRPNLSWRSSTTPEMGGPSQGRKNARTWRWN